MAKPSIFSRDYEKRMKKRKIKIIAIIGVIILILGALFYNFTIKDMNFANLRDRLQEWVDSGKPTENAPKQEQEVIPEPEKPVEPEKTYLDIELPNKEKIKCEYIIEEGKGLFKEAETKEGYKFDISPNKEELITIDKNQNMYLVNITGEKDYKVTDITKKQYVSKSGTKFPKDARLEMDKKYVWHAEPKFVDDNTIVYVSQLPYFGTSANKEYVWIYNIKNKTDKTLWKLAGKNITINNIEKDKGINIDIDGTKYIVDINGNIVK